MKLPDNLQAPLDIKRMFAKYAKREDLTPEEVEESWEAFKKWYADTLVGLWKRKIGTFFKRQKTPDKSLREKSFEEVLASFREGVPLDVLQRIVGKPSHEVLAALQELEAQDKAVEVGYDVWRAK